MLTVVKELEYLVYSVDEGFVIVDTVDEQSAEMMAGQESVCLGAVDKFDSYIVERIRSIRDMDVHRCQDCNEKIGCIRFCIFCGAEQDGYPDELF